MDFDNFWKHYPRKVAKADARKAWKQTEQIRPPTDEIIKAIALAARTEQWMRGGGQFIPYAATWLRGERWADEYEVILPEVHNEKPWHETASGIEKKGLQYGLMPSQFTHWQEFKAEVLKVAGHKLKVA
jgi:hypothetical protein